MTLDAADLARYRRQIPVHGLGRGGQERLKESVVFIAGAGGLGSPVATYLALAGVGHLVLADMDTVEISNLNRQFLHWDEDIGAAKVESAAGKLRRMNPSITVTPLRVRIREANVCSLVRGADLIIDALDTFEARYLLNTASLVLGLPLIHGSVRGLEGRITTLIPGKTGCLECMVPEAPPQETVPVLGAVAGVIGSLQAAEAVKLLTGTGSLLTNRMILVDGEYMEFHEFPVCRDPACRACSLQGIGE